MLWAILVAALITIIAIVLGVTVHPLLLFLIILALAVLLYGARGRSSTL